MVDFGVSEAGYTRLPLMNLAIGIVRSIDGSEQKIRSCVVKLRDTIPCLGTDGNEICSAHGPPQHFDN